MPEKISFARRASYQSAARHSARYARFFLLRASDVARVVASWTDLSTPRPTSRKPSVPREISKVAKLSREFHLQVFQLSDRKFRDDGCFDAAGKHRSKQFSRNTLGGSRVPEADSLPYHLLKMNNFIRHCPPLHGQYLSLVRFPSRRLPIAISPPTNNIFHAG